MPTAANIVQIVDQQQPQSDVAHGTMNLGPEPGHGRTRSGFASQRGQNGSQQLRDFRSIGRLDQYGLDDTSFGLRVFGDGVTRQEAAGDRGLSVVGGADDQKVVRPHAAFGSQDPFQPRMRVAGAAVPDP